MRLIGTLPTQSDAVRFGDFLLAVGLPNHVEASTSGDAWMIWIERDDDIEQGQLRLREYQANPNDPRYAQASNAAQAVRRANQVAAERRRRNFTDVRTSWSGARPKPTTVSLVLITLCVIVGVLTKLNMDDNAVSPVTEALLFQPISALTQETPDGLSAKIGKHHPATMFSSIAAGQVWRLVTPIFLHFGPIHLIFNLSWLATLGFAIERRRGSLFFVLLVLFAAVASNCVQALWAVYGLFNADGYSAFGGFSGVNYALFGYAFLKGKLQPYEGLIVPPQTVGLMIGWLFICMTGMVGPVANAAHVGGFLTGALVGAWPALRRKIGLR